MTRTRELPSGTVTFVFTDIEGSTRLLQEMGSERYAAALMHHRELVRRVVFEQSGVEFGTEGDAFFVAFERATDGLRAAQAIHAALARGPIRVRIGVHSGEPLVIDGDYVGLDVHKAARICSAAHGGQALVSARTRELADVALVDLGEHRLKDLTAPERLFQLGSQSFPPPRSLHRTNLPVQPTPLLGRDAELAELLPLARAARLLTLTGPGGTGKTRLALELAALVAEDHVDGTWWVPLAGLADPALVLPTIASAVGAHDELGEHLADKRLLLVLDNFEQLLDAAPGVGELLARSPGLRVIATSRERLALAAEQEFAVPPLTETAATELFVTRARQVKSDLEPDGAAAEICRRLDCLPLAIELAATRVKLLAPDQILARLERRLDLLSAGLRDLPARQATMRAAIGWSYDLLTEDEQRVFRALGQFAGSFDLEAAERIGRARLDDLQSLVDKSLLRQREDRRFFLLETTREYAADMLAESGEHVVIQRRHADWYLALAVTAREELRTERQRVWLERLRAENDNLRAVLEWALVHDVARGVRLAETLFRPWHMHGRLPELIRWYERALDRVDRADTLAGALGRYGSALAFCERYADAEDALRRCLALHREAGDRIGEAHALNELGSVASGTGAPERALRLHEEALAIFRAAGNRRGMGRALHCAGENLRDLGDLAGAAATLEEATAIDLELGDRDGAMTSLHSLGDIALDARDRRRAESHYRDALAICDELADERSQAYCLAGLACVAALDREREQAGRLWAVAEGIEDRLGTRMLAYERARYERTLAAIADDARFRAGYEAGRTLPLGATVGVLLAR